MSKQKESKHHNHLPPEALDKLCEDLFTTHVKSVRIVQEKLYAEKICEHDFLNILIGVVTRATAETIEHISQSSNISKKEAIDIVLGGISQLVGADFISLQIPNRKPVNATSH